MIRVNLLGLPKKIKRGAPAITLEGTPIMILFAVVLLAVLGVQYWRYTGLQAEGVVLDEQIQQLTEEEQRLAAIRARYDTNIARRDHLERRIAIINDLEERRSGPVPLLTMLATTVSNTESLWLTGFDQTGQSVLIEGIALNMDAVRYFLTQLQRTNTFSNVDMEEAREDSTAKEVKKVIFRFTAQLAAAAPAT
ncbi:MAG: PilN domain-containing protein [Acidobacteria bacterium]|nr:PilN domain-containing protein [Acidobacteriota bacterium]